MSKAARYSLRALAAMTLLFGISAFAQDMHTSSQFQGPKANKGTVTHSVRNGKNVLTLSDDFVVPDTPIRIGRWLTPMAKSIFSTN